LKEYSHHDDESEKAYAIITPPKPPVCTEGGFVGFGYVDPENNPVALIPA
jgi:hypothetical protein